MPKFLHPLKGPFIYDRNNGWWEWPLLPEIFGQTDPIGAKSPIFNQYLLVAPQL